MDFEFHPDQWLAILRGNPVLLVLLGGMIGGTAFTQTAKLFYLAFPSVLGLAGSGSVSEARYNFSITVLASMATFAITDWLWLVIIHDTGTGLRHPVSLVAAVACPYAYKGVKALVAWKFPAFAAKWGDNNPP
jgi:hypothetical protein